MSFSEEQVIEVLAQVFSTQDPRVILGIGDDAALVNGAAQQILTTDIAVEGVHFRADWSTAFEIGQRIAIANIADVLAMNGRCDYLLVAATLTGNESLDWIKSLAEGIQAEASRAGAVVVGGDLARSQTLSIAITAVGHAEKPILRSGAVPGDSIFLSSLTGWSAAGLAMLQSKKEFSDKAITRYKVPAINFNIDFSRATSMSDVSDAVLVQGAQMAKASGVGFSLHLTSFESAEGFDELLDLAEKMGAEVLDWILQGGEDHVLLATGRDLPGINIGHVHEGSGISLIHNMREIKMAPVSWSHFS
ncbi:MAG: thiamine-phosphate kinase [Candidatus Planktophila sp.]